MPAGTSAGSPSVLGPRTRPERGARADLWPATRLALKANRRRRRAYWTAFGLLAAIQAAILGGGGSGSFAAIVLSIYIVSWIVPAVAAIHAAREITLGRWSQVRISCARTVDLWCAHLLIPVLPWLLISAALVLPVFGVMHDSHRSDADFQIGRLSLYLTHLTPWSILAGVLAYGFACAAFAAICAFRMKCVRSAAVAVYVAIAATGYLGAVLALMSGLIGDRFRMPALTYALYAEPWVLPAPAWMVGGTIYSIRSSFVGEWIIPITAGSYVLSAVVLGAISYAMMVRARRAYWTDARIAE